MIKILTSDFSNYEKINGEKITRPISNENGIVDQLKESLKKRNNNYNIGIPKVRRKVLCVETGIIYNSLKSVNIQLGLHHHRISQCCKGIRNTCGGYHWRFI